MSTNSLLRSTNRTGSGAPVVFGAYTPILTATISNPALANTHTLVGNYSVINRLLFISLKYQHASPTGSFSGNGDYRFSIPPGFNIDYTDLSTMVFNTVPAGTALGIAHVTAAGQDQGHGTVYAVAGNLLAITAVSTRFTVISSPRVISNGWYPLTLGAKYDLAFSAMVPIL